MSPLRQKRATLSESLEVFAPHCVIVGAEIRTRTGVDVGSSTGLFLEPKSLEGGRYLLSPGLGQSTHGDTSSVVVSIYLDLDHVHTAQTASGSYTNDVAVVKEGNLVQVIVPTRLSRRCRSRGWRRLRVSFSAHQDNNAETPININAFQVYVSFSFHADSEIISLFDKNGKEDSWRVIILPRRSSADWMGSIPDDTPLGELCIPGTHESCALYGFPVSQCQQPATGIDAQLLDGIRYLDVRLRVVGEELLMYHGPRPQRSSLPILLDVLHRFLTSHPTETFILCLKEETPPTHPDFAKLVYNAFAPHSNFWFLENRIPNLGEVRGKGILMTRFEATEGTWEEGLGVHPSTWPDSRPEGFQWDCGGTTVRTQDWYRVKTFLEIPEKFKVIVNHLQPTLQPREGAPFSLSYTSASYFPLSLPTTIAKGFGWPEWGFGIYGINQRIMYWLLVQISEGKKVRACLPMDYYRQCGDDRGLAEVLISMNYLDVE